MLTQKNDAVRQSEVRDEEYEAVYDDALNAPPTTSSKTSTTEGDTL